MAPRRKEPDFMTQFLIIPQRHNLEESLALAKDYHLGFEFNDFYLPDVLDDASLCEDIIATYRSAPLPSLLTSHGDFFDVLIFSDDKEIRKISARRIRESLDIARKVGAGSVIFHTNHNPSLKADIYVQNWLRRNADFWNEILTEYTDLNIYMENMFDDSPKMLEMLSLELCKHANYGVCFDYAHAALSNVPCRDWAKTLAPFIKHVHINDNDLITDLHLAVGDGKIDWEEFISLQKEYFSDATVLIETATLENQRRSVEFLKKHHLL